MSYDVNASTPIAYCPWCSRKLPGAKRELWYETLHKLGFADPGEEEIPDEFNSDAWWRKGGI